jgi:hypothetical protein
MLVYHLSLNCDSSERNNGRRSFFVKFKFIQSQNRNRLFDYLRPTYPLKHVGRVKLVDDTQVLGFCLNQGQVYFASSIVYVTCKRSDTGCWMFVIKLCGHIKWKNVLYFHYGIFTEKSLCLTASLKRQNKEWKWEKCYCASTFVNLSCFAYVLCLDPETKSNILFINPWSL